MTSGPPRSAIRSRRSVPVSVLLISWQLTDKIIGTSYRKIKIRKALNVFEFGVWSFVACVHRLIIHWKGVCSRRLGVSSFEKITAKKNRKNKGVIRWVLIVSAVCFLSSKLERLCLKLDLDPSIENSRIEDRVESSIFELLCTYTW